MVKTTIGTTFGSWTVLGRNIENKRIICTCKCKCGAIKRIRQDNLRAGISKKCNSCRIKDGMTKHGGSYTRLYSTWKGMRSRCNRPQDKKYPSYGGRGISVCQEWNESFAPFQEWAMSNGYDDSLYIDRIDNDKGYSPENCRWTDRITQQNNRRSNRIIRAFGEEKTLVEWSRDERCKVSRECLYERLSNGWNPQKAITKKPGRRNILFKAFGEEKTAKQWSEDSRCAVHVKTLRYRLYTLRWNTERALRTPNLRSII